MSKIGERTIGKNVILVVVATVAVVAGGARSVVKPWTLNCRAYTLVISVLAGVGTAP